MQIDYLAAIKRVILDGYFVPQTGTTVRLVEEANKSSGCQEVNFKNAENVIVFKFDQTVTSNGKKIVEPFPFLSEESPARSKCDYILFHIRERRGEVAIFVIVCNLKSGKQGNMLDQLHSGTILGEFILKTAIRCLNSWMENQKGFVPLEYSRLQKRIVFREVAIATKKFPIRKGVTKPGLPIQRIQLECGKTHEFNKLII